MELHIIAVWWYVMCWMAAILFVVLVAIYWEVASMDAQRAKIVWLAEQIGDMARSRDNFNLFVDTAVHSLKQGGNIGSSKVPASKGKRIDWEQVDHGKVAEIRSTMQLLQGLAMEAGLDLYSPEFWALLKELMEHRKENG